MQEGFWEEWGGVVYWLIYCLSVIIFYTAKGKHSMSEIVYFITELVVLAAGIISIIATIIKTSKSESNKTDINLVKLQSDHGDLGHDHKDLKRDHTDISSKIERNENRLAEIKRSTDVITSEIEIQKREKALQEKLLTPEQIKINDMAKSIEEMHSQWLNQNKTVVQMQEEIDSLKKENAVLKKGLAAYKKSTRKV